MLEIDGSYGEGGGQILRTALSLSCLLGKPFRMFNIRKNRRKPGLMPQHLTGVRAAALLSGASLEGDSQGSTELVFGPRGVKPGAYHFDIGTAGSTSLLMQTLLPPLIFGGEASTVSVKGGTHAPLSPPFHYLREVFLPMLKCLGIQVEATIESYGFYPRGGGVVRFAVAPADAVKTLDLTERGRLLAIRGVSAVGNLPLSIAERQRRSLMEALAGRLEGVPIEVELAEAPTPGQGTFVFVAARFEGVLAGASALGARGKRAETVGEEAAREFLNYYRSGACLDAHMADQLVLYLALARGASRFTASALTLHLSTNLWVIGQFLPVRYETDPSRGLVRLEGSGLYGSSSG